MLRMRHAFNWMQFYSNIINNLWKIKKDTERFTGISQVHRCFSVQLHLKHKFTFFRTFDGRKPNLVVADPDMLKGILVKNFDCFTNRPDIVVNNRYLELAVGGLRDQQWKDARGTMSGIISV